MGDDFVVIPQLHAQVVQARLVPDGAALPLRVGRRAAGCTEGVIPDPTGRLTLSCRAVGRDLNQKHLGRWSRMDVWTSRIRTPAPATKDDIDIHAHQMTGHRLR